MKSQRYILVIIFLVRMPLLHAQEEEFFDHSPQEIYGPQTTLFRTIADIKYNQAGWRPVVSSIHKMHRFTYKQQAGNKLQDLGNHGTATKPIFYVLPKEIGATSGFYVYDLYFLDPHQIKYYDTKSPYTDSYVVLANYGSYLFDACHSRSFNQNWHLGAGFQAMLIDKEFIPRNIPGDRQVISYPCLFVAHYKTNRSRYQILGSFYRKKHRVRETGGIFRQGNTPMQDWLVAKIPITNNLSPEDSVESSEMRHQYHLYHQLALLEQLQIYHEILHTNQFNHFKADKLKSKLLKNTQLINPDSTQENTAMQTLANEVGLKGDISNLFYCCYYRHKKINLKRSYLADIRDLHEHYMGLQTRLNLRDRIDVLQIGGEYLLRDLYQFHIAYQGTIGDLAYEQCKYKPSWLAQHHQGNHQHWENNNLSPTTASKISGSVRLGVPSFLLQPQLSFIRVKNLIYFRRPRSLTHPYTIQPQQAKEHAAIITLGTDVNLTLWSRWHVDNELIFTKLQGPDSSIFRVPDFLVNTRIFYANTLYDGRLDLETGLAIHWRSSYKADAYDPTTQQFFLQDDFSVGIYPVADLFFSFRIKNLRACINITHLTQDLFAPGYFVTPSYPAQMRSVDVGISWSFFE